MKREYFTYHPVKKGLCQADIRQRLPAHLGDALIQDPRMGNEIWIDADKIAEIHELDRLLKIGKKRHVAKYHHVDIDKADMESFEFFRAFPRDLYWGKDVTYEISPPTCGGNDQSCPTGWERTSPVRLDFVKKKSLIFGQIWGVWDMLPEFIVSGTLKDRIEHDGLTGLAFEPCVDARERPTKDLPQQFFVARVDHCILQCAHHIVNRGWCRKCAIISNYHPFDLTTPRKNVSAADFQLVSGISVGRRHYRYRKASLVLSRRALQFLMGEGVRFQPRTFFLQSRFEPLVLSDEQ